MQPDLARDHDGVEEAADLLGVVVHHPGVRDQPGRHAGIARRPHGGDHRLCRPRARRTALRSAPPARCRAARAKRRSKAAWSASPVSRRRSSASASRIRAEQPLGGVALQPALARRSPQSSPRCRLSGLRRSRRGGRCGRGSRAYACALMTEETAQSGDEATGAEAGAAPEGIDAAAVERWFAEHAPGVRPPLRFERISGGRSNLTYGVTDAAGSRWALRRPPLGKRLGSAHDMSREHKVIAALQDTAVPVPPVVGLCEDEAVNGAPFYVMEFVEGPILRTQAEAAAFPAEEDRRAIGERVVDTLAAIHAVDPDEVGLGDLGRKDDYVARQLHRWQGQWEKSKTRELAAGRRRPRASRRPHPRAGPGDDRARRLPARQHDPLPRGGGRRGRRLGALHPRRPARRRRPADGLLVRAGRRLRAALRAGDDGAGLSHAARSSGPATRSAPGATSPSSTSTSRSASGSWRSSSRASSPATPPASTARPTRRFQQFAPVVEQLAEQARRGRAPAGLKQRPRLTPWGATERVAATRRAKKISPRQQGGC